jgi:hypothetical protein
LLDKSSSLLEVFSSSSGLSLLKDPFSLDKMSYGSCSSWGSVVVRYRVTRSVTRYYQLLLPRVSYNTRRTWS